MNLEGLCKTCLGCNRLEDKNFRGVNKCPNELSPQERIKKVLGTEEGKQIKIGG